MSVERFASLTLDDKLKVAMTAAFIIACAAVAWSSVRIAALAKGDLGGRRGDEPEAG